MTQNVLFVQRVLTSYRVPFVEGLRAELASTGITLRVAYGLPPAREASLYGTPTLDWGTVIRNRYLRVGRHRLVWQPVVRLARDADLVVLSHETRLLVNNLFFVWRKLGGPRIALWGHGHNRDAATASRVSEAWMRCSLGWCDEWLAYTRSVGEYLEAHGVSPAHITVFENTTDTQALRRARRLLAPTTSETVRQELGLGQGPVGLYLGSMYAAKRIEFVIDAADGVRARLPSFQLLMIGDGPDLELAERAAWCRPWMRVLGARHDDELARLASPASVALAPGAAGLVVCDLFALEVPVVATADAGAPPEFDYLIDGVNCSIAPASTSPDGFAERVAALLANGDEVARLRAGCRAGADRYTIENMIIRAAAGIRRALGHP